MIPLTFRNRFEAAWYYQPEMNTKTITRTLRNTFASLIGYPPTMYELLTRRLEG
jgi:hypothetical protein